MDLLVELCGHDPNFQVPKAFFDGCVIEMATIMQSLSSVGVKIVIVATISSGAALCGTYGDLMTDVFLAVEYYNGGKTTDFGVTLTIIAVPILMHVTLSKLTGRYWWEVLGGFFGLKPFFETIRLLLGVQVGTGHMSAATAVILCRAIEVAIESIPQTLAQVVIMALAPQWTFLQVAALCSSILMAVFLSTLSDHDLCWNKANRTNNPQL